MNADFRYYGMMIDNSRNAVMKPESVKRMIDLLEKMGYNSLMLYTEDTYEVNNQPYFGYLRGRYEKNELKEIDDYADLFGIEVIPCIQTLGHLERYTHWKEADSFKDTDRCIIAGCEETLKLIDCMFSNLKDCFRTDKIHVGLDEAWDMGTGAYLKKYGYVPRVDIFLDHLEKIKKLSLKYGYKLMMWSDMFFRILSPDSTYSADMPDEVLEKYKKSLEGITPVYWEYHSFDKEKYEKFLNQHKAMCSEFAFAGGIVNWKGFTSDIYTTKVASDIALNKCKEHGVKEIYATIWGDNGGECDFYFSLYGLSLYAEHMYENDDILNKAKENFEFITKAKWDAFEVMGGFHHIFDGREFGHPNDKYYGKRLLWQDILLSNQECFLKENDMVSHYGKLLEKMKEFSSDEMLWQKRYTYAVALFDFMTLKCEIGTALYYAYKENNKALLENITNIKLDLLYDKLSLLRKLHIELWYDVNKVFGAEVLDTRYSGQLGRIKTAKERLSMYLSGALEKIEELEEERIPYATNRGVVYSFIVSPGIM